VAKEKEKEKVVNQVGASEVDAYVAKHLTGWQKFVRYFTGKKFTALIWSFFRGILLIGLCFLILYPIIVRFATSFKSSEDVFDPTVILIPRNFTFDNYLIMWKYATIPQLYLNTFAVSGLMGLAQMVSCMFVAYGLARFKFKGNGFIFIMCIFTLMIPAQLITTSMYFRYKAFNPLYMFSFGEVLYNVPNVDMTKGWTAIALLSATGTMYRNGLFVFLLRQYFVNQPKELEEAAYIDGAGFFKTFLKVMLPSALPLLVTVFLFAFVWQYNDYFYVKALNPNANILATKIQQSASAYVTTVLRQPENGVLRDIFDAALMIMHITPLVALYVVCQKSFTQSIERSGMVG